MGLSSHWRRRRRAVDGEQLLALGAAAVAKAGGEACAKAEQPNAAAHPDLPHYLYPRVGESRRVD